MRIFSRIALALAAVLFAWRLGPALVGALAEKSPEFRTVIGSVLPDAQNRSGTDWLKFIVAIFIFWLLFKAASLALGFMVPQAQLFGTTKVLRRFQGLCGEGFIIFSLFMGVTLLDAMMRNPPPRPLTPEEETRRQEEMRRELFPPHEIDKPLSPERMKKAEEAQKKQADEAKAKEDEERMQGAYRVSAWQNAKPPSMPTFSDWFEIRVAWMAKRPSTVTEKDWQDVWDLSLIPEWDQAKPSSMSPRQWYEIRINGIVDQGGAITAKEWQRRYLGANTSGPKSKVIQ